MGALWHGFADMGAVERDGEFVLSRGEGAYVWDSAGTRYLDATAGLWFANVGHGRTQIADAVAEQLSSLAAYSTFATRGTRALTSTVTSYRAGALLTSSRSARASRTIAHEE